MNKVQPITQPVTVKWTLPQYTDILEYSKTFKSSEEAKELFRTWKKGNKKLQINWRIEK